MPSLSCKRPFRCGNGTLHGTKESAISACKGKWLPSQCLLIQRSLKEAEEAPTRWQVLGSCSISIGAELPNSTRASQIPGEKQPRGCYHELASAKLVEPSKPWIPRGSSISEVFGILTVASSFHCGLNSKLNHSFLSGLSVLSSEVLAFALSVSFFSPASLVVGDFAFF